VAVLTASIGEFSAKMGEAKGEMAEVEGSAGAMSTIGKGALLGIAGAAAVVGIASVKLASDFQTQMTRLYTAAGAPKQAVLENSNAILAMATSVGQTGTAMAEALYHPISAGLDMATALNVVKYSAEEAQISGASLDDTTYSLSSVMKAFNLSAADAEPTMASLNAIVGEGDMRFQDFNESVKNWAPTAAQMGISINSMGAGLAYLTDRGNSAEVAATRMTMGISMMTTPSKQAATLLEGLGVASSDVSASSSAMTDVLKKTGITQNKLALDLKQPDGLYVALKDLQDGLNKAGISGTEADSVLAKIFGGGRSDKAIMSLMQNLDGLHQKFDAITADSTVKKFEQNWEDAKNTFGFQMKQLGAYFENLGIKIGSVLMPILSKLASWFLSSMSWLGQHKALLVGIASGAIPLLVLGLGALTVAVWDFTVALLADPLTWVVLAFMALGFAVYELITHFKQVMNFLAPFGRWVKTEVIDPIIRAWDALMKFLRPVGQWINTNVVQQIVHFWQSLVDWAHKIWPDISRVIDQFLSRVKAIWQPVWLLLKAQFEGFVTAFKMAWTPLKAFFSDVWDFVKDTFIFAWDIIKSYFQGAWQALKGIAQGIVESIKGIIDFVVGIFSGDWARAWNGIKEVFGGIWTAIRGVLGGAWTFITGVFAGAGTWLINAGGDIIRGLWDGISAAGSWLWGMVKGWADGLISGIKSFFGISSPSKVTHEMGGFLAQGLANGILANTHLAVGATTAMVAQVLGAASGLDVNGSVGMSGAASPLTAGLGGALSADRPIQIVLQLNPRDVQQFIQQGILRKDLRNTGNGLTVGVS
jgi:TP901 family phage tail tape measure protein